MSAVPEIHRHGWDLPVAGRATLDQEPRVAQDCSGPITSRRPAAEPGEESAVRCAASACSACPQAGVDSGDRGPVSRIERQAASWR